MEPMEFFIKVIDEDYEAGQFPPLFNKSIDQQILMEKLEIDIRKHYITSEAESLRNTQKLKLALQE